jgi:hypothetical protein
MSRLGRSVSRSAADTKRSWRRGRGSRRTPREGASCFGKAPAPVKVPVKVPAASGSFGKAPAPKRLDPVVSALWPGASRLSVRRPLLRVRRGSEAAGILTDVVSRW